MRVRPLVQIEIPGAYSSGGPMAIRVGDKHSAGLKVNKGRKNISPTFS
jgi:hypothetical protein